MTHGNEEEDDANEPARMKVITSDDGVEVHERMQTAMRENDDDVNNDVERNDVN